MNSVMEITIPFWSGQSISSMAEFDAVLLTWFFPSRPDPAHAMGRGPE
jgi:hypothetical protein